MEDQRFVGDDLRRAAQHLEARIADMPEQVYLLDPAGCCLFANSSAELTFRGTEGLLGRPLFEVFPDLKATALHREFRATTVDRTSHSADFDFHGWGGAVHGHVFPTAQGVALVVSRLQEGEQTGAVERQRQAMVQEAASLRRLVALERRLQSDHEAIQELLIEVLDTAIAITDTRRGTLQVANPRSGALHLFCQRGFDQSFCSYFSDVRDGSTACAAALRARDRVVVTDIRGNTLLGDEERSVLASAEVLGVQSTPLLDRLGIAHGVVSTHTSHPLHPPAHQLRSLDLLARQAGALLERRTSSSPESTRTLHLMGLERVARSRQLIRTAIESRRTSDELGLQFIALEIELGHTFLDQARITRYAQSAARCRESALRAYLAATDTLGRLHIDATTAHGIMQKLRTLEVRLQAPDP